MDGALRFLEGVGAFLTGLLARTGIFLVALAALAVPALLLALAARRLGALRARALGLSRAGGLVFCPKVRYAPGHTWIAPARRGAFRVGIDDLAQRLLPAARRVEVPRPGRKVREGELVAAVSSGGRSIAVAAPVGGTVVAVNRAVLSDPGLVKRESYGRGWLFTLAPSDARLTLFPEGEPARDWLEHEADRLARFVEQHAAAAADGGELTAQAPWLLEEDDWKALAETFLRAR